MTDRSLQANLVTGKPHLGNQRSIQLALYNTDGTERVVPSRAAARADVAALTSAQLTGGESPTEAEFNALQADVAAQRTVINDLLAKLRTANVIAT